MNPLPGSSLYLDGIIMPESKIEPRILNAKDVYYEVMRVIDGKIAFFDAHIARLFNSLKLSGNAVEMSRDKWREACRNVVAENHIREGNLKFCVVILDEKSHHLLYPIPYRYPTENEYYNGVRVGLVEYRREAPNIKKWNQNMKDLVRRIIARYSLYEALMYNTEEGVTEGSKSNLFFLKGQGIYTAPMHTVLPGITRKYVIQAIRESGHTLVEAPLPCAKISDFDGAFITGTSPKILPVRNILNHRSYTLPNEVISGLMQHYDAILTKNLSE